ncbi:MAG: hypothetical protein LBP68_08950 [Acidobacteriota bacterium]|jgi:hypothetical protein|nr:hypothetical protein [Acidobacteriota bacterium]
MKKSSIFLATAVLFLTSVAAYAQSLGDLAKEEQKRREEIEIARVIVKLGEPTISLENDKEKAMTVKKKKTEKSSNQVEDTEETEADREEGKAITYDKQGLPVFPDCSQDSIAQWLDLRLSGRRIPFQCRPQLE